MSNISINLIARDNASGLTRDALMLMELLQGEGFDISWCRACEPGLRGQFPTQALLRCQQRWRRWRRQPRYDVNLFIEGVVPWWVPHAHFNLLIPNQDWFHGYWRPYLKEFDYILCKTEIAEKVFSPWGRTLYIGFTSEDCQLPEITPNYDRAFHLGSDRVRLKTDLIWQIWREHPDFPPLTLSSRTLPPKTEIPKNLTWIRDFIPTAKLRRLQNSHGVHLYPTRIEGFGHRITEAMSCRGALLTTDAPPMNEIVTPDCGILVPYEKTQPQHWGTQYHVTHDTLTAALETLWGTDISTRRAWGKQARQYYEERDRSFRQRLPELLRNL